MILSKMRRNGGEWRRKTVFRQAAREFRHAARGLRRRRVWARGAPASFAVGGSGRSEAAEHGGGARVLIGDLESGEQVRAEMFSLSRPLFLSLKMIRNE